MNRAVIVIPTYNEAKNILRLLQAINRERNFISRPDIHVLVVDDSSPDGTARLVKNYSKMYPYVHLLADGAKEGLGKAYIRGFKYALKQLEADVVFEMDADFSHDPGLIPHFIKEIQNGADFVIGSRYIPGGAIPEEWPIIRKMNSKYGNVFARQIAGLSHIKDCTSGYRAMTKEILNKIDFSRMKVKGYSFQMNLLHEACKQGAVVSEIPLVFVDRVYGDSKIRVSDVVEFVLNAVSLGFPIIIYWKHLLFAYIFLVGLFLIGLSLNTPYEFLLGFLVLFSLFISAQSLFNLYAMLFAWEDPEKIDNNRSPSEYIQPETSFTVLLPVRKEERVIRDTIMSIAAIDYPTELKQVLIIIRGDDTETFNIAHQTLLDLNMHNMQIVRSYSYPINKPHSLNVGIKHATKDVIVVFDAEDQPHRDILNIANTVMVKEEADILQSGVQLMNYRSNWFSTLNVLEYFFWFKSTLHYFASQRTIPLGGNTVFMKRDWIERIGGWDERCLTEDADIGIRMSAEGAKVAVVYDELHVTQEETPHSVSEFIKQRTRWNQGFLQVFFKGDWKKLPTFTQRLLAMYILTWPIVQSILFLYIFVSIATGLFVKVPVFVALISSLPLYMLVIQFIIYNVGLYEFTKRYNQPYPIWMPLKLLIVYYPYNLLLAVSGVRAVLRNIGNNISWEKTTHLNTHRENLSEKLTVT